jgi:tol-pal system protein YbgF
MQKRLLHGLLGARFAKPLFNVLVLTTLPGALWAVQVTESSPSYVAPSERIQKAPASSASQASPAAMQTTPDQPVSEIPSGTQLASEFGAQPETKTVASQADADEVEDFGIITDGVKPANPLADDRELLIQELQTLRAKVENQERQIGELKAKSKALYEDLDRRLQKMAEKLVALERQPVTSVTTDVGSEDDDVSESDVAITDTSTTGDSDQARYQKAKAILDEGGRDTKAALEFVRLLKDYPDTPLKPNVYYWLAQIYKRGGEFEKAEGFYNRVLEEYPKSLKAATSLYSLAIMKGSQGKKTQSEQLLKQLLETYPNSAEARKAKSKLSASN